MARSTQTEQSVCLPGAAQAPATQRRLASLDVLVLSLWCGLAAGLLEVGARILCRYTGLYPALHHEPAFRLAGSPGGSGRVFRDRRLAGSGDEALASARRVAQPTRSLRHCRPAGAHGRGSPDLYGGLVDRIDWGLRRSWFRGSSGMQSACGGRC